MFLFHLGLHLGKTVTELSQLPAREIVHWQSFFKVKNNVEDLARRSGGGEF